MSLLEAYITGREARRALTVATSPAAAEPFSGKPQPPAKPPPTVYGATQQRPPPRDLTYDPNYHGHTFGSFAAPIDASGFSLDRAKTACRAHRQGIFLESYLFAVASMSFAPVFAALMQRVSPSLSKPRFIRGGKKGLARLVREEVEAQIAPSAGLWSSPCFPSNILGSISLIKAMMGFCILQHVTGDADPVTGVREVWTRIWPPWATRYDVGRRVFRAITSSGEIDVLNDGKFTLVADMEEPHLYCAAILALADSVMQGVQANQACASYVEMYGRPKPVAIMPPKVGVRSDEGAAFLSAVEDVREVDGVIVMANGSELSFAQLAAETSQVFVDTDERVWKYVAAILLGSDGTISKSGVYESPDFAGVRHDIVDRDLKCSVRGINDGHVRTYVYLNYSAAIEQAKARGLWVDPVLEIPLPDPAAAARIEAKTKQRKALSDQVIADRAAGAVVDQDHVNAIAADLEAKTGEIYAWHIEQKIVAPDQLLARLNLPALPGGIGSPEQLAKERAEGKDKTGATGGDGASDGRSHEAGQGNGQQDAHAPP